MALHQPIKTTTNSNIPPSSRSHLRLPPPQTFDILPPLHELLARVEAHNGQTSGPSVPGDVGEDHALTYGTADIGSEYTEAPRTALNPKELPVAVLEIKARIRAALREVEKLPDVDRSVEDQEEELRELETRIARQRAMLRTLGDVSATMKRKLGGE